ncbi:HNH/ENDO VII family nuclease [Bacillus mycoides]|nr:HNH/ENDO VII family nuclease [Bacillus mycoides]
MEIKVRIILKITRISAVPQIQLHHTTQREPGSMVELPASKHREYSKQLHGTIDDGDSFRNDPVLKTQYKRFRDYYWKQRAQDNQK